MRRATARSRQGGLVQLSDRDRDLIIIAPARATVGDVEKILGAPKVRFEIHFDRRRGERRRAADSPLVSTERRRQRDRRNFDVSESLRTTGWALIPAEQRSHS